MGLSEIKKDIVGKNKLLYVILQLITWSAQYDIVA